MNVVVFQPPYPADGTTTAAEDCLRWMQAHLDRLSPGAQRWVLLPEYANAPGLNTRQATLHFAEGPGRDFLQTVGQTARRIRCLIGLAAVVQHGDDWFNRGLVFGETGQVAFSYDKIHLTGAEKEELGLTPGTRLSVFQNHTAKAGFAICFDQYFPEHFEALARLRADIVLCPSYQRSESAERIAVIARARALDSGTYVVRSSYAMQHRHRGGRSLVVAPDATILADAGQNPCVIRTTFDPARKFVKPSSHGHPPVEHRSLIERSRATSKTNALAPGGESHGTPPS